MARNYTVEMERFSSWLEEEWKRYDRAKRLADDESIPIGIREAMIEKGADR